MTPDQAAMAAVRLRGISTEALILSRTHQSAWHADRAAAYAAAAAFLEQNAPAQPKRGDGPRFGGHDEMETGR